MLPGSRKVFSPFSQEGYTQSLLKREGRVIKAIRIVDTKDYKNGVRE